MAKYPNKNSNNPQKFSLTKKFFAFCLEPRTYNLETSSGYTLIEMLAVIFIITLLMGTTLYNYSRHKSDEVLLFETQKLAQFIRRAQNVALSPPANVNSTPLDDIDAFGIKMSTSSNAVLLFADVNGNYTYQAADEEMETLNLDSQVNIQKIYSPSSDTTTRTSLNIAYIPPDPTVVISETPSVGGSQSAQITISLTEDASRIRSIYINSSGLVSIQ